MSNRALSRSLLKAAADTTDTAAHCSQTIAARLPIFAGCLFTPTGGRPRRVENGMCGKGRGGHGGRGRGLDGVAGHHAPLGRSRLDAGRLRPRHAPGDEQGRPSARRRVKANAKRLSRAKSKA
jgi:hypothetical protein